MRTRSLVLGAVLLSMLILPFTATAAIPREPDIVAPAAVVVDLGTGSVVWGKDLHTMRPPASVTKIATTLAALDMAPLDRKITIQQSDLIGESSMGVEAGESLTLESLLYGLLLPSGNDAATAIARGLGYKVGDTDPKQSIARFVEAMNTKARTLGTRETHFVNPHGLDEMGHLTSASDLGILGAAFAANPVAMHISGTVAYDGFGHTVHTTNKLLYDGRYSSVIGGKTGLTDEAGYTLVEIASKNGRRMLSVELGTTADAFWTDAMHLLDYGFAAPTMQTRTMNGAGSAWAQFTADLDSKRTARNGTAMPLAMIMLPISFADIAAATQESASALTLPPTAHTGDPTAVRLTISLLLLAAIALVLFARRGSVTAAMDEAKHEWHTALRDPPHLAMTTEIPLIPMLPTVPTPSRRDLPRPAVPSVSARWAQMGAEIPREESAVARAYALRAIRQAQSGDRISSCEAFRRAAALEPKLDWGMLGGFWELPASSYADLARALIEAGNPRSARTMLTVAALAYPRHPDLVAVEKQLQQHGAGQFAHR